MPFNCVIRPVEAMLVPIIRGVGDLQVMPPKTLRNSVQEPLVAIQASHRKLLEYDLRLQKLP